MLVKFALSQVQLVQDARTPQLAVKTAQRTQFRYDPLPGHIYVRSRAISSRVNENYDGFPADEIKAAWRTFIGRPVFVNHHNEDISRARGVIVDAALHEDHNADGSPDTWVEVLMAIDAVKFPRLAEAVVNGWVDRTSMGTAVAYTICSVCDRKAETPAQYCNHIARLKGQRVIKTVGGKRQAVLVFEECHGLNFFENSLLVEDPADPSAVVWDVDTRAAPHLAKTRTAMAFRPMETDDDPVTDIQLRTAALRVEAKPKWENPAEHPWYQQHPISSQNIIDHWNRATPEDIQQGKNWYPDAHTVAKAIAGGDAAKGAGVLAAYSPQTLWPVNMFNAARALDQGKAIGGPGSGVMATGAMAAAAQRMIDGEHHSKVLTGPKIQDFAHLIEHGGDQDPAQPHAVIDRHAMSVAAGGRLSKDDMEKAPTSTRHYYNHAVQAYKDAADQLSQQLGRPIAPHEVQATTWLVRQRENALEDQAQGEPLDKGRERSRQKAQTDWEGYQNEHYPELAGPGYYTSMRKAASMQRKTADLQAKPSFDPDMWTLHDPADTRPGGVGRIHRYFMRNDDGSRTNGYRFQIYNHDEPHERVTSFTSPEIHPDLPTAISKAQEHYTTIGRGPDAPINRQAAIGDPVGDDVDDDDSPDGTVVMTAPPQVNTLQSATCPVCGDVDSISDGECNTCGYAAPPEPFDSPDTDVASDVDRDDGQPIDENQPKPPLYMGQRANPSTTVGKDHGMTNQTTARTLNAHKRINALEEQIKAITSGQSQILAFLQKQADEMPPQFKKKDDDSGSDNGSDDSKTDDDSDDSSDDSGDDDSDSGDGDNDDDSDDNNSSDDSSKTSLRERRRRAYLAAKGFKTAESDEQARQPAAKDDPSNIGSVPSSANTNVTPDATTSVDSSPTSTTLVDDDAKKVNVETPEPGVDNPPSPDSAKVPNDITVGVPQDNSTSFNTGGPGNISWAAKGEPQTRFFAAMRLAQLRRTAGIAPADEEELVVAQKIVDGNQPLAVIQAVSTELDTVIQAARTRQASRTAASTNLVPQNRVEGQRSRPSLTQQPSRAIRAQASTGSVSADEFGDLI